MSFAFWRKCDFQIHSPRDRNWVGARPVGIGEAINETGSIATERDVDEARALWARNFVEVCVTKGLQAVALTDHHEMTMVPYVQKEIERRRNNESEFDFWLFPGMELTARGGKQCLIIFDSDLSEEWRKQAQGKLGIVHANTNEKTASSPKLTHLACNYADIAKSLDELEDLRGKYIILPNVSQGKNHTVLTEGGHGDFFRMPYVGGYLDRGQTIETLSKRNQTRLSGNDSNWSLRKIYPLPTSDNRSADFKTLGKNNTWIKLAEPTAEAIRQAYLGYRSRIQIVPPRTSPLVVAKASITGSMVLKPSSLGLSPELNAIIGGRGSGKSSFLEYIAFGLGRSCYDVPRDHYSGTERMRDLISETLISGAGCVVLEVFQDNANFHIVRSPASSYQPQITYPNGTKQTVSVKELRRLFPAVVYSQGELADIGKQAGKRAQLSDLLQFVNPDYKREADHLSSHIESAKGSVRSAIQALATKWELQSSLRKLETNRDSLQQRVKALEKSLPNLSATDQAVVDNFEKANNFDSKRIQASKHADQVLQELDVFASRQLSKRDLSTELKTDAKDVQRTYQELFQTLESGISNLRANLETKREEFSSAESAWSLKFDRTRVLRDGILEKLSNHKSVTHQIIKLQEDVRVLSDEIGDLQTKLKAQGDPGVQLEEALNELRNKNERRSKRTQDWANEIEQLSNGKIRAVVAVSSDTSEITEAVDVIAAKSGSKEATRISKLEEALESDSPVEIVDRLRKDCLSVLYWRLMGAASGEDRPKCSNLVNILGDTEGIRRALNQYIDTTRVEAIATAVSLPEISLYYCDGIRQISFDKASEGQRAAALLFMLLEQSGGPLIIDQPEGDLDNKIIAEVTEKLHGAKQIRQLIFASHNANIVVNGSAELVAHLDVSVSGERLFECTGAIDKPNVRHAITSTMEGGEKAFRDRQSKYGY